MSRTLASHLLTFVLLWWNTNTGWFVHTFENAQVCEAARIMMMETRKPFRAGTVSGCMQDIPNGNGAAWMAEKYKPQESKR